MGNIAVQIEASSSSRQIGQAKNARPNPKANPVNLLWSHLINQAVHDAKKTRDGMPTDTAILARWWIAEHRPTQDDKVEWQRSFECACGWLDKDVARERKRVLAEIDAALKEAYLSRMQELLYVRRAMVMTCAGFPTSIARQFVLPLVAKKDYEDVAGIEHGDKFAMYDRREIQAA